ncbi:MULTISPECIES: LysM peptidoglycan-binding domain-containing protein [unclassified Nocardioides]|uniref:LysM peptidoglycan-binding domain-containing protein n=1 Tax=unclassified Nocardioides TaxID=2615069 RepID=UPI0009F0D1D5|nr:MULTISPECIES: LysM peptidoglycan-binding domain-containing protein [unclassified Nocardioides]GAW48028.1 Peptidoglycan-binding LysM [Nocardioides sp. PD653-B2]GAW53669.1 Peptidoglycan-binding LysM [Nocardioides sp. PD653]
MMRLLKALVAALALAALVVGPPWALLGYIGNPWPAEGVSLSAPITDGAIIGLLAVVVWVLWAQLIVCVVVEAIAALTDDRITLKVPFTLGVQQDLARQLVTAVVVAFVATPVWAGPAVLAPGQTPGPEPAPTAPTTSLQVVSAHHRAGDQTDQRLARAPVAQAGPHTGTHTVSGRQQGLTTTVTVMRLDSLWSIAERHLGEGDRWPEIATLNEGRIMNDGTVFHAANPIRPGWVLLIPTLGGSARHAEAVIEREEIVVKGDTLSEIALEELGDAQAYPELFEASKDIVQPGGVHLTDPDRIFPGWTIKIPGQPAPAENETPPQVNNPKPPPEVRTHQIPQGPAHDQDAPQEVAPHEVAPPNAVDTPAADQQPDAAHAANQDSDEGGVSALHALLATAACLSVGALGLVAANRRRQFRHRRIGRTIASIPEKLVDVEQTIIESGRQGQDDVVFLDRALRHVGASCKVSPCPLPQLGAAVLGAEDLTLLFTHPATGQVPEGWSATEDSRAWVLPRETFLEQDLEAQPAPYPALVSIGLDEGGRTWLLDLETLGMCGIGGEPQQVADLVRFMVAELAVNAWSEGSEVLLADRFGAESLGLNPARLRQVQRREALTRAAVLAGEMDAVEQNLGVEVLARRRDGVVLDSTNPVVVVVSSPPGGEFLADIAQRDRSRVVILYGDSGGNSGAGESGMGEEVPAVELAPDGMAFLPMWGISVKAFSLPATQAQVMAELLASTRSLKDEPVPATRSDDGPLGKYAKADGSLREEYTGPRRREGGDPSSMLPEADELYLATAATTAEDLAAVAPSVPEEVRAELADLDPTLDQDLADWLDHTSPRPKVHLLGPVEVTALHGGDPAAIDNAKGTVSFIAYLAWLEKGVTGERAAAECGWTSVKTVQNRGTNARFLLGKQPDGSDWLPDAAMSSGAQRGTSPTYELLKGPGGVLNSADLFVRLRHRAQRRGDAGCQEDLVRALSLVTGAPFEGATEHRFKWLTKTGRPDDILAGAIHEVAHTLATRAVAEGRIDLVRLACETARRANPNADISWLDQAAATEAEAGRDAASELVREHVVDRYDEDLPARSETVIEQREWWATG